MDDAERERRTLMGPAFAVAFLVGPKPRQKQTGMEDFSDSAIFHRLHSTLWTFTDPSAVNLLGANDRQTLHDFERIFAALPWQPMESHPHISQLANDDLTPLVEPGRKLLAVLNARIKPQQKKSWLWRFRHKRAGHGQNR